MQECISLRAGWEDRLGLEWFCWRLAETVRLGEDLWKEGGNLARADSEQICPWQSSVPEVCV